MFLSPESIGETDVAYRLVQACEPAQVCRDGAEAALLQPAAEAALLQPAAEAVLLQPAAEAVLLQPAEALDVSDQEPTQAARGAYRCRPKPKCHGTSTNPDNGEPTHLATSHSHIQGSPPVEQLPVLAAEAAEPLQSGQGLQHILALAGKVCNQGCRKICLFHRDFPRDQYVAQEHECYNKYIRQERILSMLSIKFLLYFS